MNFKINNLNEPVECTKVKFPDIESLKFGNVGNGKSTSTLVFDATAFCEDSGLNVDINNFMKVHRNYIERLIQEEVVSADKLFFIDKEEHVYISSGLEVAFLMYVDKEYQIYFSELIEDILTNGIAVSDGFVLKMAMERIPDDTLQDIIKHRNEKK